MTRLCEYVQTSEAAEILGVSINTIRTWAAAGKLRVSRNPANGYRLFRRDDLEKFLSRAARPERLVRVKKPR
ncbi:MAG: helix-turn-helix domain-containing protein [Planctomycetes bacterium]|nr:helix-turn-helix domain-containing protein [Planctomycetota bacterium]